jgi:hypothetical protein
MDYYLALIVLVVVIIIYLCLMQLEYMCDVNFHKVLHPKYYKGNTFDMEKNNMKKSTYLNIMSLVNKGKILAKKRKIVICGLGRNIETNISNIRQKTEFIGEQFEDYKIVCFENDSEDDSRNLLKKWVKENNKVHLLKCEPDPDCKLKKKKGYELGSLSKNRIDNMIYYREQYMTYVKNNLSDYDYMMVIDFDLDGNQCMDGLFHTIALEDKWDAVFINGKISLFGTFGILTAAYDALAFVSINDKVSRKSSTYTITKKFIEQNINTNGYKLIPVKSAFNGYGLYKIKSIINCSYNGNEACEHINLANCMINNGCKLYINPLWTGYFDYHGTGPGGPLEFIKSL